MSKTLKELLSNYDLSNVNYKIKTFDNNEINKFYDVAHTASPMFFNNINSKEYNFIADITIALLNKIHKHCNGNVKGYNSIKLFHEDVKNSSKLRWIASFDIENVVFEDFCFLEEQKIQNIVYYVSKKLKNTKLLTNMYRILLIMAINNEEELSNGNFTLLFLDTKVILLAESSKQQFNHIISNYIVKSKKNDIFVEEHKNDMYIFKNDKESFLISACHEGVNKHLKKNNVLDKNDQSSAVTKYINLDFSVLLKNYRTYYKNIAEKLIVCDNKNEALRYVRHVMQHSLSKTLAAKYKITAKQACQKYSIEKIVEDQWRA